MPRARDTRFSAGQRRGRPPAAPRTAPAVHARPAPSPGCGRPNARRPAVRDLRGSDPAASRACRSRSPQRCPTGASWHRPWVQHHWIVAVLHLADAAPDRSRAPGGGLPVLDCCRQDHWTRLGCLWVTGPARLRRSEFPVATGLAGVAAGRSVIFVSRLTSAVSISSSAAARSAETSSARTARSVSASVVVAACSPCSASRRACSATSASAVACSVRRSCSSRAASSARRRSRAFASAAACRLTVLTTASSARSADRPPDRHTP